MGPAHNHIILITLIDWDDWKSYKGASQNLLVLNFEISIGNYEQRHIFNWNKQKGYLKITF